MRFKLYNVQSIENVINTFILFLTDRIMSNTGLTTKKNYEKLSSSPFVAIRIRCGEISGGFLKLFFIQCHC